MISARRVLLFDARVCCVNLAVDADWCEKKWKDMLVVQLLCCITFV